MNEVFVFLLGTLAGSFAGASIYRMPLGMSLFLPRSHCARCHAPLKAADLIPVLSWLWLGGKCRYCRCEIGRRELLLEIFAGILYVAAYQQLGGTAALFAAFALIYFLLVIAYVDYDCLYIFNKALYGLFITGALFHLYFFMADAGMRAGGYSAGWLDYAGGFLVGGALMFFIFAVSGGMGLGDVWFTALAGFWLGTEKTLLMILLAFILGGIAGMALVLLGKKKRRDYIAFAPFLAAAVFLSYLYGNELIEWYKGALW